MKKTTLPWVLTLLLLLSACVLLSACDRGEGGAAGYGAGGGQSLREGSTAPYHSPIAQNQTYQKLLGLNILLYPAPVDDPKFEAYGKAHWELDAAEFVQSMQAAFTAQKGEQAVYEPAVEALQDLPLIAQIQETIYQGEPVQVGWVYGNNASLDLLEYNGVTVTLVTADAAVLFAGSKDKLDPAASTFDVANALAVYIPEKTVVELGPNALHSMPVRALEATGQLTAVIVPKGLGLEPAAPGQGLDQALVANGRWVFAFADNPSGYFAGLKGSNIRIESAD